MPIYVYPPTILIIVFPTVFPEQNARSRGDEARRRKSQGREPEKKFRVVSIRLRAEATV